MEEAPNFDAAPTVALFTREMERVIGTLRPGRDVEDFQVWAQEIKLRHGHEPYGRLRRAVTLLVTQSDQIPVPSVFAMFMREAERQLGQERRLDQGLLPVDETRREREERETYHQAYLNAGPGTEAFEWNLCLGIAQQRKRKRLLADNPTIDTISLFRTPGEKKDFGPGMDEPDEQEIRDVYAERRDAGIAIGRSPTATSQQATKDSGNLRPIIRDPARWIRQQGGFKSTRDILEERRREGRLEPRMEEYLLQKIREEEGDAPPA
jgi:hypothetical protein